MRNNQPISQREFEIPDDTTLMSTTDIDSHIRYANAAFISVSGFDRDELLGQPHNLVRHPDMPREAFADMWATLKAGDSWTALVKNRRKNGDHYWVRANATPVMRNGRLQGYMSVRTKPTRAEIDAAEAFYRDMREGRAGDRRFHKGLVTRTGWMAWRSWPQRLSASGAIRLGAVLNAAAVPAALAVLDLGGAAIGVAGAVSALAAGAACLALEARLARPLGVVLRQAKAVASGSPERNLNLDRVDEVGMILRAINQSGLNLRSLVDDVHAQVLGLTTASGEIAAGSTDLSVRT